MLLPDCHKFGGQLAPEFCLTCFVLCHLMHRIYHAGGDMAAVSVLALVMVLALDLILTS